MVWIIRVLPRTLGKSQVCQWVTSINIHLLALWYVSVYYPYLRFHTAHFERGTTHQRCAWRCSKLSFIFPDSQQNQPLCGSWCRHLWPVAVSSRFILRRIFAWRTPRGELTFIAPPGEETYGGSTGINSVLWIANQCVWASAGKTLLLTSLHTPPVLLASCQLLSTASAPLKPVSNPQHQLITERW